MNQKHRRLSSVIPLFLLMAVLLPILFLSGCSSNNEPQTGVFIDSPVSGLNYTSAYRLSGVTNEAGQFRYYLGDTISFYIGTLELGSAPVAGTLTPLSITPGAVAASEQIVNNKLILLQSLDADGDLNNGIQLTAAIRAIVSAHAGSIIFDQSTTDFRTSLGPLMTALNTAGVFSDSFYRGERQPRLAARPWIILRAPQANASRLIRPLGRSAATNQTRTMFSVWASPTPNLQSAICAGAIP